jgi:hypothetical protein
MQEAVSSTKYAVGFLKLVFKMSSSSLSLEAGSSTPGTMEDSGEDKLFAGQRSCEVSPKNVLDLASDRAFEEDFSSSSRAEDLEEERERGGRSLLELSGGSDANVSQRRKKKERPGRISSVGNSLCHRHVWGVFLPVLWNRNDILHFRVCFLLWKSFGFGSGSVLEMQIRIQ